MQFLLIVASFLVPVELLFTYSCVWEFLFAVGASLKTLASLNKEVRPFFLSDAIAFGVIPLFLPLAITAFGGPEG